MAAHPVDIALHFIEYINHQDLIRLVSLMPENHTFVDLAGKQHHGRGNMQRSWARYFQLCPEYRIHVGDIYFVESDVIIIGRTIGSHLNQAPHLEIRSTFIWDARIMNDLVEVWAVYYDTTANRSKLNLVPENRFTNPININNV